MAMVIGSMGLCYYIKDVVVSPKYQGKWIDRMQVLTTLGLFRYRLLENSTAVMKCMGWKSKFLV